MIISVVLSRCSGCYIRSSSRETLLLEGGGLLWECLAPMEYIPLAYAFCTVQLSSGTDQEQIG